MNSLKKSDLAVIVAGNRMTGNNKQITIPKLGVARVAADHLGSGSRKAPVLWSASQGDFTRLHLHTPNDMNPKLWKPAFLITVRTFDFTRNEVHAGVLPIFVSRAYDLRVSTLPRAILAALDDGKPDFVGKAVTVGHLSRATSRLATAEA